MAVDIIGAAVEGSPVLDNHFLTLVAKYVLEVTMLCALCVRRV